MTVLLDRLREDRKSPLVLKARLLGIRSARPGVMVFVFEGEEDIGIYDVWIRQAGVVLPYEPLPGSGKEQVVAFAQLLDRGDAAGAKNVFCFVDCDFDVDHYASGRLFVLDAYSTENILSSEEVLHSICNEELRCATCVVDKIEAAKRLEKIIGDFDAACAELSILLLAARRSGTRVIRKPDSVGDFLEISIDGVRKKRAAREVIEFAHGSDVDESAFDVVWEELSWLRRHRGKYVLQMFRRFLFLLCEDRRKENPVIFKHAGRAQVVDVHSLPLRSLASRSSVPGELAQFLRRNVVGARQ